MQYDLGRMVRIGLQQQRVHVGMTGNTSSLGLHSLRTSYFQTFRCGIAVERHVLRFEWGRGVTVLLEYAAQGGSKYALANVASRTSQHHGM